MKVHRDQTWTRRGLSLLWDPTALGTIADPNEVRSIRQLFALACAWPDELPSSNGNALIVAGLEGCLDSLSDEDAEVWLEHDLKRVVLSFQMEFEGTSALVFWLPSGRRRISMSPATEQYYWKGSTSGSTAGIPIGRSLWGGAESDVARILASDEEYPDCDGDAFVGLYHPRIS